MAGTIAFKIDKYWSQSIGEQRHPSSPVVLSQQPHKFFPEVQINIDSIISIGSTTEVLPIYKANFEEARADQVGVAFMPNVILFLKDFSYNNGVVGGPSNASRFVLSNFNTLNTMNTHFERQWDPKFGFYTPNLRLQDYYFKDAKDLNKRFNLLEAVTKAIESNDGSGVSYVSVGIDRQGFNGTHTATPQPFRFNQIGNVSSSGPGEPGGPGGEFPEMPS